MQPAYQPDLFAARVPHHPFCTDDLAAGVVIRSRAGALRRRYIQHNPPTACAFLVFDLDNPGAALAALDAGLAEPNWIAVSPDTTRGHVGYALNAPIITSTAGRRAPVVYAAAVEQGYRDRLRADVDYAGFITKTPGHAAWRTLWGRAEGYTLDELAEYLPTPLPRVVTRRAMASGLGRNVSMFEALRVWAYRARLKHQVEGEWMAAVLHHATSINAGFSSPLPDGEVRATAKSVGRWVWARMSPAGFAAVQSERGRRSAAARASSMMDTTQRILEWL